MNYQDFIKGKEIKSISAGFEPSADNPKLFQWQSDIVLTPFLGIGSEAYVALELGRRAIGIELKPSYYRQAVKNCAGVTANEQTKLW